MREIPVGSKGERFIVDDEDHERVMSINWYIKYDKSNTPIVFNIKRVKTGSNKMKSLRIHRFILNVTDPNIHVDHINHNRLDNRKCNLRLATTKQNNYNKTTKKLKYKYRGVQQKSESNIWASKISFNSKGLRNKNNGRIHLGNYKLGKHAALAYDIAATILHGEFAVLNFRLRRSELKEYVEKFNFVFDKDKKLCYNEQCELRKICRQSVQELLPIVV